LQTDCKAKPQKQNQSKITENMSEQLNIKHAEVAYIKTDSHIVNVQISSNCNSFTSERKFDKGITVQTLKDKLELITGARSGLMTIEVFDQNDVKVCDLKDLEALIGSFPIEPQGFRLHVTDSELRKQELEDTNGVEKFELTDVEYSKKTGTVRDFMKKNRMGKYNPEEVAQIEKEKAEAEQMEKEAAGKIAVADRCEVAVPGQVARRGEVKYIGEVHFKPGMWVGIQYDEPFGKNDGSVEEKRYFQCQPKYGGFVRVANVTVGDFPEEGFSDDEI